MFFEKRNKAQNPDIKTTEGFSKVYSDYVRYVYTIFYQYLGDKEQSQDLTSKLFTSLWERRSTLEVQGSLKRYLSKAAKLKIIDYLRSREREHLKLHRAAMELSSSDRATEHQVAYRELEGRLKELIDRMPPRAQEVFKLSRHEGMSVKQIAAQLAVSENTVKTHLANALAHLRENLPEYNLPKRAAG